MIVSVANAYAVRSRGKRLRAVEVILATIVGVIALYIATRPCCS